MHDENIKMFLPFEKKDDDQRIVAGYATTEMLDSQGEIVKLSAVEQALPEYMKYANIREMHQFSAVGKTIEANVDQAKKGLYIVARIIDDTAWKKVKEGVYNGFSIGGKVLKRIENEIHGLSLNEISVVDRPANPGAVFALVKSATGDLRKDEEMMDTMMAEMEKPEFAGVYTADELIQMATHIAYLIQIARQYNESTERLEKLLENLIEVIKEQLDAKKIADLNYSGYFDALRKAV